MVKKYKDYCMETNSFTLKNPTALQAIKFRMLQKGLKQKDMVKYFDYDSVCSKIFRGEQKLSLRFIKILNKKLDIPIQILME